MHNWNYYFRNAITHTSGFTAITGSYNNARNEKETAVAVWKNKMTANDTDLVPQ